MDYPSAGRGGRLARLDEASQVSGEETDGSGNVPTDREAGNLLNTSSPLGKYAEPVTAGAAGLIILAAIAMHIFEALSSASLNTAFLDNLALLAVGVLFGGKAVANGSKEAIAPAINQLEREVLAAHKRLDATGAPPANDGNEAKG